MAALGLLFSAAPRLAAAGSDEQTARTLVHLLDYIAQDYGAAVADGKVISEFEFQEMTEFCQSARGLDLNFFGPLIETEIQNQLRHLEQLVLAKASHQAVAQAARAAKAEVLRVSNLALAPSQWPDLAQGERLYAQNCAVCHGPEGKGDGPSAPTLEPAPSNFHDPERMAQLSPFQAYNTISLGIQGTGMASFSQLADRDIWALSFYTVSLRHREAATSSASLPPANQLPVPLATVAALSDIDLLEKLPGSEFDQRQALASLRLHSVEHSAGSLTVATSRLREALDAYRLGQFQTARQNALTAYLEGVEPVEPRLKAVNAASVRELEKRMLAVRQAIDSRRPVSEVEAAVVSATDFVAQAEQLLAERSLSPLLISSLAAAILLREGFEAILVIIAILGVLRAVHARRAARWVHAGWISAVGLGVICWFFSDLLMALPGLQRELMEAVTSLVAVLILLYLGFWLHSKTEIGRWKAFIEGRVKAALQGGNLFGLASISFLAVFREAIETVLFLSALGIEGGSSGRTAIISGVLVSSVLVAVMAWVLVRFSARLPIRALFAVSAVLMSMLAIVLTGKGLHSLQESGVLSVTSAPFSFRWDLVGFYPTIETILVQAIIVFVTVALWIYGKKPSHPSPALSSQS